MRSYRLWETNPIIIKEMRSRMRGVRSFATLTGSLILMGAIIYSLYRMTLASSQYSSSPISPQIGQILFTGLAFMLLIIIAAITPSVTSGEISGEKEKQTYEMLLTTPLSPGRILSGKLFTSMSYVFLILFAAIPMASLVFIYGGVNPRDMLKTLIALLATAVMFGVIGLFCSALFNRSGRATVVSYLLVGLLMLGPIFAGMLSGVLRQSDPLRWIMIPSPIMVVASTFQPSVSPESISSTFWMFGSPVYWILGSAPISMTSIPRPAYHIGLPLYGLITLILYLIATRLVKPVRRWKIHWSEAMLAFVLITGYLGLVTIGYFGTTNRYENILIVSSPTPTPLLEEIPDETTPVPEAAPEIDTTVPPEMVKPTPLGFNYPIDHSDLHAHPGDGAV
jgi:ABC-type transport system involved in multi-copper enzyme maturation permease subunit